MFAYYSAVVDTDTLMASGPVRVRVLRRWQQVVHRFGSWLQDFAYDHSPEQDIGSEVVQFTYTETG